MNPEAALRAAGFLQIAGVDEAGRGAYAGPLVVAAVILNPDKPLDRVGDSKKFSESERAEIAEQIKERALAYTLLTIESQEIDQVGLHLSNIAGMRRAITALSVPADYIITDGYSIESVGAASVLAKNHRDQIMIAWDKKYPEYGFAAHKGYGTASHQRALTQYGVLPIHRRSFAPIAKLIDAQGLSD
jgi:ribonuclease HII